MRDDSPTGGALGQVSERELSLNASLGSLSQMQSEEQLEQILKGSALTMIILLNQ